MDLLKEIPKNFGVGSTEQTLFNLDEDSQIIHMIHLEHSSKIAFLRFQTIKYFQIVYFELLL